MITELYNVVELIMTNSVLLSHSFCNITDLTSVTRIGNTLIRSSCFSLSSHFTVHGHRLGSTVAFNMSKNGR